MNLRGLAGVKEGAEIFSFYRPLSATVLSAVMKQRRDIRDVNHRHEIFWNLRLIVLPVTTSDILGASKGRVIRLASLYAPEPRKKVGG